MEGIANVWLCPGCGVFTFTKPEEDKVTNTARVGYTARRCPSCQYMMDSEGCLLPDQAVIGTREREEKVAQSADAVVEGSEG